MFLAQELSEERELILQFNDCLKAISDRNTALTIGRRHDCDLVVEIATASRLHARIEKRKCRIIIMDQSTNGTFIKNSVNDTESFVHREDATLPDKGFLYLGVSPGHSSSPCIDFEVVSLQRDLSCR